MDSEYNFGDFESQEVTSDRQKIGVLLYGEKGVGKSVAGLGFGKKVKALSLDRKTMRIRNHRIFKDVKGLTVYDGVKYMKYGENTFIPSAVKTFAYLLYLLTNIRRKGGTDWILVDGLEKLIEVCEMKMRGRHRLRPFQGVEFQYWKHRKLFIREFHATAMAAARYGVIYTTYTKKDEIVKDGQIITAEKVPKWTDIIMEETDCVIHVIAKQERNRTRHLLKVVSSKEEKIFKTGETIDFTGKRLYELLDTRFKKLKPEKVEPLPKKDKKKKKFI